MSDKDFEHLLTDVSQLRESATQKGVVIKDVKNPHSAYWKFVLVNACRWVKENKIIGGIIIGFAVILLAYFFGLNK